ncbi:MAG TPA: hypothetical protein VK524_35250 [Polyangiaceae bacterium]|nr:hypothetical protein [Polyangiaceae bacterium]
MLPRASLLFALYACACTHEAPSHVQAGSAQQARLGTCRDLWYEAHADADSERAPFVRGASGLAHFGEQLAVVQDDTQFLGLIGRDGSVHSLTLPPGPEHRRRFEAALGNKHLKLDFEAVTAFAHGDSWLLIAFGSGSSPARESILVVEKKSPASVANARLVPAKDLYAMLRAAHAFCGGKLNIEGAASSTNELVLLQRGMPVTSGQPINAALHLELDAFLAWLNAAGPLPRPTQIRRYRLGRVGSLQYGFSGLTALDDERFVFTASAEDTTSALLDGPVIGSRIGLIAGERAWAGDLVDSAGRLLPIKAEGVLSLDARRDRFWIVLDSDDSKAPARLCEVHWPGLETLGEEQ